MKGPSRSREGPFADAAEASPGSRGTVQGGHGSENSRNAPAMRGGGVEVLLWSRLSESNR